ncbi:hypothetical protein [Paenibacillus puerhi]|uniref:hypothetical protein n=1 Tax=Paenibacillus puerhi TaxID=2692622 RepID=UPI0013597FBB|nr:hypothetical protein [Paenibacillus puerhi]
MKKLLPINLDTGITTDCWHFMKLAPILSDERFTPWYIERFIELEMGIKEGDPLGDFWVQYYRLEYIDLELLYQGVLEFNRFDMSESLDIVAESMDNIDRGGYVLLGCDNYYVRKSMYYQKHHCMHEYLLFGYNMQEKIFHILSMKENKWTTDTITFEEIEQGMQSGLSYMRNEFDGHYRLFRFDMPATSFFLKHHFIKKPNLHKVLESIQNYLTGGIRTVDTGFGTTRASSTEWIGISIYDGLINRICELVESDPSLLMERNIILGIKKIGENKRGMLFRMKYLHDHQFIHLPDHVVDTFQLLSESLDKLLSLVIVYHYRPEKEHMSSIKKWILQSEQLDRAAMERAFQVIYDGLYKSLYLGVNGSVAESFTSQ